MEAVATSRGIYPKPVLAQRVVLGLSVDSIFLHRLRPIRLRGCPGRIFHTTQKLKSTYRCAIVFLLVTAHRDREEPLELTLSIHVETSLGKVHVGAVLRRLVGKQTSGYPKLTPLLHLDVRIGSVSPSDVLGRQSLVAGEVGDKLGLFDGVLLRLAGLVCQPGGRQKARAENECGQCLGYL